jgi:hypothetical protein
MRVSLTPVLFTLKLVSLPFCFLVFVTPLETPPPTCKTLDGPMSSPTVSSDWFQSPPSEADFRWIFLPPSVTTPLGSCLVLATVVVALPYKGSSWPPSCSLLLVGLSHVLRITYCLNHLQIDKSRFVLGCDFLERERVGRRLPEEVLAPVDCWMLILFVIVHGSMLVPCFLLAILPPYSCG